MHYSWQDHHSVRGSGICICQRLLDLSLRRSDMEDLVTSSRAAMDILQLAFSKLPIARVCPDKRPVQLPGGHTGGHQECGGQQTDAGHACQS